MKYLLKSLVAVSTLMLSMVTYANTIDNLFRNPNDPVAGNPKGKVTVVEFFDYQCSHCVSMTHVMNNVIKANPNLRVVYKDFPIRGPMSQLAAKAAIAANLQGKYVPFSHALLNARQPLNETTILNIAKNNGLNVTELKKQMHDKHVQNVLRNNFTLAQQMRLTGTPAFFIGLTETRKDSGVSFVLGEMSQRELQAAIDKASKQKL